MSLNSPSLDAIPRLSLTTMGGAALSVLRPGLAPELAFEAGKPLALLTYLAFSPRRAENREHLAGLLWATLGSKEAKGRAIRQTIWQIRRKLGDQVFDPTPDPVRLLASIETDRDTFLAAWERRDFESVVRLYAGEFLPRFAVPGGLSFEHWADVERAHLRGVFARAAESVIRTYLSGARYREATTLARRLRDQDLHNEVGWRLLLETLIASRDLLGAPLEADALERFLAVEEVEPEPETSELLRLARSTQTPTGSAAREASHPAMIAELVGREREFSALIQAWGQARAGHLVHVHLAAPAGLGKSRLLADFYARLRASLGSVVLVRANFGSRGLAYAFASDIAEALAARPGSKGIPLQAASALVALNPTLSARFEAPPDQAADEELLRHRALAFRELIVALTEDQPLALLLDDLHWSDPTSLRLLEAVLGAVEGSKVLVVSAARLSREELQAASRATELTLQPLSVSAIGALLSSLAPLPNEAWADQLPLALREATGGSPLLALETLQLLREREVLTSSAEGWRPKDPAALFAALGDGSALLRRVQRLDDKERAILLLLATGGVPLSVARISSAANRTPEEVGTSLAMLEQRGLVSRRGDEWAPAHDEHAAAVLAAAPVESRREASKAVGRAFVEHAGDAWRQLQRAGPLLAHGDDLPMLFSVFERFVRQARLQRDRRSDRLLAGALLGLHANERLEAALVRSLPWRVRARLVSNRRVAAALVVVALVPLSVAAMVAAIRSRPRPPAPAVVVMARRRSPNRSKDLLYDVPIAENLGASPRAISVDLSGSPRWEVPAFTTGHVQGRHPRPDGIGWIEGRDVADSGVVDIFDVPPNETARRLTFTRGEDDDPSSAPDNSQFAFLTQRWKTPGIGGRDLAIYDRGTQVARQLTHGGDWDDSPLWSPDGSRIAFNRQHRPNGERSVCVIDVGGEGLSCTAQKTGQAGVVRWTDSHRLLLWRLIGNRRQLERINVDSGTQEVVESNSIGDVSPDGKWILCRCPLAGHPGLPAFVYPVGRPEAFTELKMEGADTSSVSFEWSPSTPRLPFLARLTIRGGPGSPTVGAPYQFRAFGFDTAGRSLGPGAARWHSSDTTIATIDSAGVLVARRLGPVRIEASAGGWRRTDTTLTIAESAPLVLLDEQWTKGFGPEWILFGDPKPEIVPSDRLGHAFWNHGDEYYFSGAYTSRAFPTGGGLWVEAQVSAPINRSAWQSQALFLYAQGDSAVWAHWDHINGDPPGAPEFGIRYPDATAGASIGKKLIVMTRETITAPVIVPGTFASGQLFNVLLQIFPDGRTGIAIDGKQVWMGRPASFDSTARVMLAGNSVGTRILVGRVRVSSGIAPDVRWSVADSSGEPAARR